MSDFRPTWIICLIAISLWGAPQAEGQTKQPRFLRGTLVMIGEVKDSKQPITNTTVTARNVGNAITTDSGEFKIQLPTAFGIGKPVTLAIDKPGYVIHYPLSGKVFLPDDEFDLIEVQMLPEGSKLLWTDRRIERFLEESAEKASSELRPANVPRDNLAKYVLAFGQEYGFTEKEVVIALREWAAKAKEDATDFRQVGLAAFAEGKFEEAAPSLVKAGTDVIEKASGAEDPENAENSEKILKGIDDLVLGGDSFFIAGLYLEALNTYETASKHLDKSTEKARWIRVQFRVANASSNLGERVNAESSVVILRKAVEAYRAALGQMNRLDSPLDWADTKNNLGLALTSLANRKAGTDAQTLYAQAETALRDALQDYPRDRVPARWSNAQNALGSVLQERGRRAKGPGASEILKEAVAAHRNAIAEQSRIEEPKTWAKFQSNLGNALSLLGRVAGGQEGYELMLEAEEAMMDGLSVQVDPWQWAGAKLNLATLQAEIGRMLPREHRKRFLLAALVACKDAERTFTRKKYPQQWAMVQNTGGATLKELADLSDGSIAIALFKDAAICLRKSLDVRKRQDVPDQWALSNNNLCNVLVRLGQHGVDSKNMFADAIGIYEELLLVWTFESSPQDWAKTKSNIGVAYTIMAMTLENGREEAIRNAIAAQKAALSVLTKEAFPSYNAQALSRLSKAQELAAIEANK